MQSVTTHSVRSHTILVNYSRVNASIGKPLLKLIDMGNQNIEIVHTGFKEMWPLVNTSLKQRYAYEF